MNLVQLGTNSGNDHVLDFVKKNHSKLNNIILVEPIVQCTSTILKNYKEYNIKIDNSAIISNDKPNTGKIDFFVAEGGEFEYDTFNYEVSSTSEQWTSRKDTNWDTNGKKIKVNALHFNELASKHNLKTIDFLFIDVEGEDEGIVKGLDFEKYNFKIVVFELGRKSLKVRETPKGYEMVWCKELKSRIYYKKEYENYLQDFGCGL